MNTNTPNISVDLIIHPQWIATGSNATILSNHSIAIKDGSIVDIAATNTINEAYTASETVTLEEHLLTPGMVNTHAHASMYLLRGLADDEPLMDWLNNTIWPAEKKWVSEEFVEDGTLLAAAEMLTSGVTTFNDMYFFPEAAARAATRTGSRMHLSMSVLDFPTAWAEHADEYLEKSETAITTLTDNPLITLGIGPHAPYTTSDETLQKVLAFSQKHQCLIHMHVHETAFEVSQALETTGIRPIERLNRLGLLSERFHAVHATQLDESDIHTLANANAHVIHCPESNLKLASGFCPITELTRQGINVALGTDGSASNNDLDMLSEARTAALLAKAQANQADAIPASTALTLATHNGGKALQLPIGTIAKNSAADLVAFDFSGWRAKPLYQPLSNLIYASTRDQVKHVWVNGQKVVDNGTLTTIDEKELHATAEKWQNRLGQ